MSQKYFYNLRLGVTAFVSIAIWALLAWNYYHGGVPRHHFLAREDMPSVSNWWGGILLPMLTWFLLYRIKKRMTDENSTQFPKSVVFAFVAALLFGVLLSVFFTMRYSGLSGYMLQSVLVLSLFFPVYRAEYILGFVIGMTFTFGAVLPTIIGSVLALIGFLVYWLARKVVYQVRAFSDSNHPK